MLNAATMTPEEKLAFLSDQINAVRRGQLSFLLCPYCGTENTPVDEKLCCELFGRASQAVLDRLDKQAAIDFIQGVQENAN